MEIGKIKWAGHYNSQTGDFNNYGFITHLVTNDDVYFRKENVQSSSALLSLFDKSDDRYVVFDIVPSRKKASQFQAANVLFLAEASPDILISKLSQETLTSPAVQQVLLDVCPDVLLRNYPLVYFPLLHNTKVRETFIQKYKTKQFSSSISKALIIYFSKTPQVSWKEAYWALVDWCTEPIQATRQLCLAAINANINITPLLKKLPFAVREYLLSVPEVSVYIHRSDRDLHYENMKDPCDLPTGLSHAIWSLFHVDSIEQLTPPQLKEIKRNADLYTSTSLKDYSHRAKDYTLIYLPVNIFKIWTPLKEMLKKELLPVDGASKDNPIKILEIGAGPGTATLGILQFYQDLAMQNPERQFYIEYFIIEREAAFIDVLKHLVINRLPQMIMALNLHIVIHPPICKDATLALKEPRFNGAEIDLVFESNVINPNEICRDQLFEFVNDICKAMRYCGLFLMLEPAKSEMMEYLWSIERYVRRSESPLKKVTINRDAQVDATEIPIVKDIIRKKLRTTATHHFSYALFEKRNEEGTLL